MGVRGVLPFERPEIDDSLELLPLAARRALDLAGLHLSLEGWRALSLETRRAIVEAGAGAHIDVAEVARRAAESAIAPRAIDVRPDLDAAALPGALVPLLGPDAERAARAWPALAPLSRYALAHVARRSSARGEPARLTAALAALLPEERATDSRAPGARIRDGALSADEAIAAISHPGAGGIALFLGVVRDENEGRAVTLLEYEAYRAMAEAELARIESEIVAAIPGARVFATHRVGALRVGDVAVVCAASAPHRGEAFAACRRLIDEIKARLPIWKREHGPDGPYWVGWEDARCGAAHPRSHAGSQHHHE